MMTDLTVLTRDHTEFVDGQEALKSTARKLLTQEIGFLYNPEFETLTPQEVDDAVAAAPARDPRISDVPSATRALPPYFAELYKIPLLSAQQEAALFRKLNYLKYHANARRSLIDPDHPSAKLVDQIESLMAAAEETRNQIIEANLRLVVSIARKFVTQQHPIEDLICEGNTILMKAVEKFDYARGFRFSTYVTHAVQRHYYLYFKRARRRDTREVGFADDFLGEAPARVDVTAEFRLAAQQADTLMHFIDAHLDDRERLIVRNRFGLTESGVVRTYQSLSEELGICKERVRQVFQAALEKVKTYATSTLSFPLAED